mgnify:FL=1
MALMFLSRRRNNRSNINLSFTSPTTLAPGNLTPLAFVRVFKGDKLNFRPSSFVQAMPMNAPLVNGFKLCYEYFFVPDRLYNAALLLDESGVTDQPHDVQFPQLDLPVDYSSGSIGFSFSESHPNPDIVQPGSLADYMGFPVGFVPTYPEGKNKISAQKMLGYLDVIYHYYINQQVPNIPTALWVPRSGSKEEFNYEYSVASIYSLLMAVKTSRDPSNALWQYVNSNTAQFKKYTIGSWSWLCSRASIFQRCLPPYYLESWLATSGYEDSDIKVDLDTDGKSISFRNISSMSHVQRWMDLALGGGSRYSDYENSQFDVGSVKHTTTPIFLGADRHHLGSNTIYQTTGAGDSTSPLGAFAGQMSGGTQFKKRSFSFGETGYFIVIASFVPEVIYQRNLDPFLKELTLGDVYAPALDNIAMEPLMVEELDAQGSFLSGGFEDSGQSYVVNLTPFSSRQNTAVGFVPAWSKLMQVVSRVHGRLATDLNYWILRRTYGEKPDMSEFRKKIEELLVAGTISAEGAEACLAFADSLIEDPNYSPYVISNAYNNVFADMSNQAQNFIVSFSASVTVNREKGKTNVPTTL